MKYIPVLLEHKQAIEEALRKANGKKNKKVFIHYGEIASLAQVMHNKLNNIFLASCIGGVNESIGSRYVVSSYRPQSHYPDKLHKVTCITLKMMEKGIVLLTEPEYLYSFMCNAYNVKNDLFITKEQEEIVLRRLHKKYKHITGD